MELLLVMDRDAVLAGMRRGNMVCARAGADLIEMGSTDPITPAEYAQAVADSPALTDPDATARDVWDYVLCVESGWRRAGYGSNPLFSAVIGGSGPQLEYSVVNRLRPWVTPMPRGGCGTGSPRETPFSPSRSLEDSSATRSFGARLVQGEWELCVTDLPGERTIELKRHGSPEAFLDLPLCVAGSYLVVIRCGEHPVAKGRMIVCQFGPTCFSSEEWGLCMQATLDLHGDAFDADSNGLSMDLTPDAQCVVTSPGYGLIRGDCPPLRCDAASHVGVPTSLRVNNVPVAFAEATR